MPKEEGASEEKVTALETLRMEAGSDSREDEDDDEAEGESVHFERVKPIQQHENKDEPNDYEDGGQVECLADDGASNKKGFTKEQKFTREMLEGKQSNHQNSVISSENDAICSVEIQSQIVAEAGEDQDQDISLQHILDE